MTERAEKVRKGDEEWRRELTPAQYRILREKGTEAPFTGEHLHTKAAGVFRCAGCGAALFRAADKYDSGTGWPSFTSPASAAAVREEEDTSHGLRRTEILCARCDGHLGHVFPDGPAPGGLRYCINSAALDFEADGS